MTKPKSEGRHRFKKKLDRAARAQAETFVGLQQRFAERIAKLARAEQKSPPQAAAVFASVRRQFEHQLKAVAESQRGAMELFADTQKGLLDMLDDLGDVQPPGSDAPGAGDGGKDRGCEDEDAEEPPRRSPASGGTTSGGKTVDRNRLERCLEKALRRLERCFGRHEGDVWGASVCYQRYEAMYLRCLHQRATDPELSSSEAGDLLTAIAGLQRHQREVQPLIDEIRRCAGERVGDTDLRLTLPEDMVSWLDQRVAAGDFADRDAAVGELLRLGKISRTSPEPPDDGEDNGECGA